MKRIHLWCATPLAGLALGGCTALYVATGNYKGETEFCEFDTRPVRETADYLSCALDAWFSSCSHFGFSEDDSPPFLRTCRGSTCIKGICANGSGLASGETGLGTAEPPVVEFLPSLAPLAAPAISPTQRTALLSFFAATGGADWFNKTGWGGSPGTECDWYGVTCNASKTSVTGLAFDGNDLRGQIPGGLAGLTDLQTLVLIYNQFDQQTLAAALGVITNLSNLVVLDLRENSFQAGDAPLPAAIGKLTRLQMLSIERQSSLVGPLPSALWSLTALRILNLGNLRISGAPPIDLAKLKNLEGLRLSETAMSGPIPAGWATNLTKLQSLVLSSNGMTGPIPAGIGGLTQLRTLDLSANGLTGTIPPAIGGLTKLGMLDLSFNQLTGPFPTALNQLVDLRHLSVIGNALSGPLPPLNGFDDLVSLSIGPATHNGPFPASWMNLRGLRVLMVPKTGLTGSMPDLSLFSDLEEVNLEGNAFTAGPIPQWASGVLPDLRKILLNNTNRQGVIPDLSYYKGQLTHLGLGRNAFSPGEMPAWLQQMSKLVFLDLEATARTGPLPPWLGTAHLQRLDFLDLSDNAFTPGPVPDIPYIGLVSLDLGKTGRTGALPPSLNRIYVMQRLILADNQISGSLDTTKLPPFLTELDLSRNRLGGPVPAALGNEGQLLSLQLAGNQLSGPLPPSFKTLTALHAGAVTYPLYGKHVGLDLRWNALSTADPATVTFAKARHEGGADFQATQTVPPKSAKATALSSSSVRLTWPAIPFQGPGAIRIEMSKSANGPFTVAGQISPKSATTFTVKGLQAHTKYFFRLLTTTPAHAQNPNALTSAPGAVISASTP